MLKVVSNYRWNRCSYCGKFMAYLRKATRLGKRTKLPEWHYDYSFADPLNGDEYDYVCGKCYRKYKSKK